MNKSSCLLSYKYKALGNFFVYRTRTCKVNSKNINECYKVLGLPKDSKQDAVRKAFLDLAKKYHPDSGSPYADVDKFVSIENAFRTLSKHNTGSSNIDDVEIVFDIQHTAPQHRQYLSYEGIGYGTPSQRQKQYEQVRASRAATNVLEHRILKASAEPSDKTLMTKGEYSKKHDIKTKYGFDRLVEDYIQEAMSKGEFENLKGKGKPLKEQNTNPYVDFTTHKLNEVLINNGFMPEWITMAKKIDKDIDLIKKEIESDRMYLGPYPLSDEDQLQWNKILESKKTVVKELNSRINTYNLIVPLLNKQKFHIELDSICKEILENGKCSVQRIDSKKENQKNYIIQNNSDDIFVVFLKAIGELFFHNKNK